MTFLELAKARCSVRAYTDKPVEQEKLEKILEAGRVAPSACNFQPWKLLVVQSEAGLEKLKKAYKSFGAPLAVIVCGDHSQAWKRSYDGKDATDIDASIITSHMMLQAAELGLGSVWVCAFEPQVVRQEFGLPDNLEPVNILFVGYPQGEVSSPDRHSRQRKPLAEIVVHESF